MTLACTHDHCTTYLGCQYLCSGSHELDRCVNQHMFKSKHAQIRMHSSVVGSFVLRYRKYVYMPRIFIETHTQRAYGQYATISVMPVVRNSLE